MAASTPRLRPRVRTRPQRIRRPSPRETRGAFASFAGLNSASFGAFGSFAGFGGFGIATAFIFGAFGGRETCGARRCTRGRNVTTRRAAPPIPASAETTRAGLMRPRASRMSVRTVGSKRMAFSSAWVMAMSSKAESVRSSVSISESSRVRIAKSSRLKPRSVGLSSATAVASRGAASVGVIDVAPAAVASAFAFAGSVGGADSTMAGEDWRAVAGSTAGAGSSFGTTQSVGVGTATRCSKTMKVPSASSCIEATRMTAGCGAAARRRAPARNRSRLSGPRSRKNSRVTARLVDSSSARQTSLVSSPR